MADPLRHLALALGAAAFLAALGEAGRKAAMRETNFDLAAGFDRIRWGDDIETVLSIYPGARKRPRRAGVDPRSGRTMVRRAGLSIHGELSAPVRSDALSLGLSLGFDERGVTDIEFSSLGLDQRHAHLSETELTRAVTAYAAKVARELGLEPFDPNTMRQEWSLGSVRVTLLLEWDGFLFVFDRPGP